MSRPQPTAQDPYQPPASPAAAHFKGSNGCFVLFDLTRDELIEVYNRRRCKKRLPACSTFKIPLAVMAFDAGVLKDETTSYKWDGVKRLNPAWNRDQTVRTWLRDSVVWVSQKITPVLGRVRIEKYLREFSYGNQNFSGGLTSAWLTRAPFMKTHPRTSLKLSAFDQVDFFKRLWTQALPVSARALELTKKVVPSETSPKGFVLAGKTGSGFVGRHSRDRLGWYVAHLAARDGHEYLSVVTFTDLHAAANAPLAGPEAKTIMKELLAERGLW